MNNEISVLKTVAEVRSWHNGLRQQGKTLAFVPTMGALHEGHLELARQGLARADCVIVSIFVNPTQFGPAEDFTAYPRTWEADLGKLAAIGAHAVFHPAAREMYPADFATTVTVGNITSRLEGAIRPGHFDGVATIVTKLLLQVLPDIALFGEKDYQQLQLIKRLAADLDIPVTITGIPTMRDGHGLALSSRNAYLSAAQYEIATQLNKILFAVADKVREGGDPQAAQAEGLAAIRQAGFDSADYLEVCDAASLAPAAESPIGGTLRVLAAVRLGKTRLIDNVAV